MFEWLLEAGSAKDAQDQAMAMLKAVRLVVRLASPEDLLGDNSRRHQ
jgi:hypothetical protein